MNASCIHNHAPTMYLLPGNILPYKEVMDCGQAKDIKVELFSFRQSDFVLLTFLEQKCLHPNQ